MRCIGSLEGQQQAQRFVDYLKTTGISATLEDEGGDGWAVWIREEDRVDQGRDELARFQANPQDGKYVSAARLAAQTRREELARAEKTRRNTVDVRAQWRRPVHRRAPAVATLMGLSIVVFVLTGFGEGGGRAGEVLSQLLFAWPSVDGGLEAFRDILSGQIWRLITPMFIHFGVFHILMNLYVVYYFGSAIEMKEGTPFLVVLTLLSQTLSAVMQAALVHTSFGGLSGVAYAYFGFLWFKTWYDPWSGYRISTETIVLLSAWLVLGFLAEASGDEWGLISRMANWGHLGGLVAGWGIAMLTTTGKQPS